MYSKVKRHRRRGERKSDHEIAADPGIVGHITIVLIENVPVMKLHGAGDDAVQKPLLPLIWRAKVVMIRGDKMLFQGFERVGGKMIPCAGRKARVGGPGYGTTAGRVGAHVTPVIEDSRR